MPAPEVIEKMVGTRRLELLTSTVSTPEFEVTRYTYKALVATKSLVGYGSSAYCDLIVTIPMPIVSVFHTELASRRASAQTERRGHPTQRIPKKSAWR